MKEGRNRHSSCGFADKFIYIFCGMVDRKRSKTISRMEVNAAVGQAWVDVDVPDNWGEARFCPGVYQID